MPPILHFNAYYTPESRQAGGKSGNMPLASQSAFCYGKNMPQGTIIHHLQLNSRPPAVYGAVHPIRKAKQAL
jgi:hypothetical protein